MLGFVIAWFWITVLVLLRIGCRRTVYNHYIMTQVILAFLVVAFDLLEDRCTDDDSA